MILPLPLQKLMEYEKNTNKIHHPSKIIPLNNFQDPFYAPEQANVFNIPSYWVDNTNFHCFFTDTPLISQFIKDNLILFLIHPESDDFYNIDRSFPGPIFSAIATSSSRTVLLMLNNLPICFAKVSLNKEISGVVRTVLKGEISRSVGTTMILDDLKQKNLLPRTFNYFREVISFIPHGLERGGMIIREIPSQLLTNSDFELMPVFSLFTEQSNKEIPIYKLSKGQDLDKYIYNKIIIPFIDEFFSLAFLGISTESHAQNLLIDIKSGNFYYRDFSGFTINMKKCPSLYSTHLYMDKMEQDYWQKEHNKRLQKSLFTYFLGSIIYGLSEVTKIPYERLEFFVNHYTCKYLLKYKVRYSENTISKNLILFLKTINK